METHELCKIIEGDPAKPDLAATTCWRLEMNCPFSTHLKLFAAYFFAVFVFDF